MAKSVDATDLKSVGKTHAGSSPAERTKSKSIIIKGTKEDWYKLLVILGVIRA